MTFNRNWWLSQLKKYLPLILILLADVAIVVLHLVFGQQLAFFNLDREANLPTVYQGLKLMSFGYFFLFFPAVWSFCQNPRRDWLFWGILSFWFIFLAVEEMAMIHENITGYLFEFNPEIIVFFENWIKAMNYEGAVWLVYYIPLFALLALPSLIYVGLRLWQLLKFENIKLFAVFALLPLSQFFEAMSTTGYFDEKWYLVLMTAEEGLEMMVISILAFAFVRVWRREQLTMNN